MYGNGWPGPTASGVSTGIDLPLEALRELGSSSSSVAVVDLADRRCPRLGERRPQLASSRSATGGAVSSTTRSRISASVSCGVRPSGERTARPDSACPISPPTRTMKNSSRFAEKIEQNFTRSRSGTVASAASSSTRPLNSSHESSRFRRRCRARAGSRLGARHVQELVAIRRRIV